MLPSSMLAMTADTAGRRLVATRLPVPSVGTRDLLLKVLACGVCRTDLHVVDGELAEHRSGVVPGHEIEAALIFAPVGEIVPLALQASARAAWWCAPASI